MVGKCQGKDVNVGINLGPMLLCTDGNPLWDQDYHSMPQHGKTIIVKNSNFEICIPARTRTDFSVPGECRPLHGKIHQNDGVHSTATKYGDGDPTDDS